MRSSWPSKKQKLLLKREETFCRNVQNDLDTQSEKCEENKMKL